MDRRTFLVAGAVVTGVDRALGADETAYSLRDEQGVRHPLDTFEATWCLGWLQGLTDNSAEFLSAYLAAPERFPGAVQTAEQVIEKNARLIFMSAAMFRMCAVQYIVSACVLHHAERTGEATARQEELGREAARVVRTIHQYITPADLIEYTALVPHRYTVADEEPSGEDMRELIASLSRYFKEKGADVSSLCVVGAQESLMRFSRKEGVLSCKVHGIGEGGLQAACNGAVGGIWGQLRQADEQCADRIYWPNLRAEAGLSR